MTNAKLQVQRDAATRQNQLLQKQMLKLRKKLERSERQPPQKLVPLIEAPPCLTNSNKKPDLVVFRGCRA